MKLAVYTVSLPEFDLAESVAVLLFHNPMRFMKSS